MAQYKITIYHLYPDLMNLYGDRGNIITLKQRCRWRGIEAEIWEVKLGDKVDFRKADFIFMGGGQDREQKIIYKDLLKRGPKIKKEVESGLGGLVICGGFQLFGKYFKTASGETIKGIGVLDIHTIAGQKRLIGNIVIKTNFGEVVGFENHSGKTYLKILSETRPLGEVIRGCGNNGEDQKEGAYYKNLYGTYLHGPILPKNPHFADLLIEKALQRRYKSKITLPPLDDSLETQAHKFAHLRAFKQKTPHI